MGTTFTRVVRQIHTRELDRSVAHHNMKRAKLRKVNKNENGLGSYFSNNWRDYINTPTIDLRRRSTK